MKISKTPKAIRVAGVLNHSHILPTMMFSCRLKRLWKMEELDDFIPKYFDNKTFKELLSDFSNNS